MAPYQSTLIADGKLFEEDMLYSICDFSYNSGWCCLCPIFTDADSSQVVRIILTNRLDAMRSSRLFSQPYSIDDAESKTKFLKYIEENSVLDSSGQYQVVPFLFRAVNLDSTNLVKKDVGVVTQTSLNQIILVRDLSTSWKGLISVAIFSEDSNLNTTVDKIILLLKCNPSIHFNTSIHLVFPLTYRDQNAMEIKETSSCDFLFRAQEHISYSIAQVAYPVNLLRNVARRYSMTEFIFVIDIDLIPSFDFRSQFFDFATKNNLFHESKFNENVVYVVPTYEMSHEIIENGVPNDKMSLVERVNRNEIRPFYVNVCWKCQKHTDYESWEKVSMSKSVEVIYEVSWQDPWEPFYVSRANVPMYDERFKQYGFNRISQVYELSIAGYKFLVLNNLFLIHRGLKEPESFHASKDVDQETNRILFRQFKNELHDKYSINKKVS